jgi:hypothetical protein
MSKSKRKKEPQFKCGDVVRVLSREKIMGTMNPSGDVEGALVSADLWDHCGRKLVISKVVTHFYRSDRMFKCLPALYMLEGAVCSGEVASFRSRCDRNCSLLWSGKWLEKADHELESSLANREDRNPGLVGRIDDLSEVHRVCQLSHLHVFARTSLLDDILERVRRLPGYTKRSVRSLTARLIPQTAEPTGTVTQVESGDSCIAAGELVKVKSRHEMDNLLDESGKYKGCTFQPEMYDYCGRPYRVLRQVDYFYDEVKQKLCKCKDLFILEGVYCTGRKRFYKDRCNLNCYPFWHKDWLERA